MTRKKCKKLGFWRWYLRAFGKTTGAFGGAIFAIYFTGCGVSGRGGK